MPHDKRDDDRFEVAQAVAALALNLKDRTMPKDMVEREFTRVARVSDSVAVRDGRMTGAASDIEDIRGRFAIGMLDQEKAAVQLTEVLSGVRMSYARPIVYEGVDVSGRDELIRTSSHMPGEKVSLAVRDGVRVEDPGLDLGDGSLRISKTVATGEDMRVDEDRSVRIHTVEYEFEGREGRYPAELFHAENGQDNAYGVVQLRDNRVFLTPIADFSKDDDLAVVPAGATREIVGGAGRSVFQYVHPDGFEGMKEGLRADSAASLAPDLDKGPMAGDTKGPMVGEFSFDTAFKGDETGPVRIAGIPWSSTPSAEEMKVASREVDAFLAAEDRRATLDGPAQKSGLMSQAGSIGSPEAPTQAKGTNVQAAVDAAAAVLAKGDRGR